MNALNTSVFTASLKTLICAALAIVITGLCTQVIFSADGPSGRTLTADVEAGPAAYGTTLIAQTR